MSSESKLSLSAQSIDNAEPNAKPILDKALEQVGFIPNMYGLMVNSPGLLDTYLHGYKLFREQSGFTPAEQEIVFLTISYENNCHYCVAAHSMIADKMSNVPAEATQAIRDGAAIPDAKLQALNVMTTKMVETRGNPSKQDINEFLAAGYSEKHALEIVLAIAVKTISNYSNHLFNTPVDDMFSEYAWQQKQ
ncbi:MAG: carboxymuconolactone decarboxylase family protein [Proteobacteria bacterium]|nr:carboxymuconolactone decarboxylase family protein [Pseudomonadota bacterium]